VTDGREAPRSLTEDLVTRRTDRGFTGVTARTTLRKVTILRVSDDPPEDPKGASWNAVWGYFPITALSRKQLVAASVYRYCVRSSASVEYPWSR
jgi:hypothetical protein